MQRGMGLWRKTAQLPLPATTSAPIRVISRPRAQAAACRAARVATSGPADITIHPDLLVTRGCAAHFSRGAEASAKGDTTAIEQRASSELPQRQAVSSGRLGRERPCAMPAGRRLDATTMPHAESKRASGRLKARRQAVKAGWLWASMSMDWKPSESRRVWWMRDSARTRATVQSRWPSSQLGEYRQGSPPLAWAAAAAKATARRRSSSARSCKRKEEGDSTTARPSTRAWWRMQAVTTSSSRTGWLAATRMQANVAANTG